MKGADQAGAASPAPAATAIELPEPVARRMPARQRAVLPIKGWHELHGVPIAALLELAARIVKAAEPIEVEEIARRVASSSGRERARSHRLAATSWRPQVRAAADGWSRTGPGRVWPPSIPIPDPAEEIAPPA